MYVSVSIKVNRKKYNCSITGNHIVNRTFDSKSFAAPVPGIKHTILYADDDRDDLMIITDAFNMHTDTINIITALNGEEALIILAGLKNNGNIPCLIILDINMPLLNGKDLLKQLKQSEEFSTIPVVLLSTSSNPDDIIFARQYSTDFFTKPSTYPEMKVLIKQLTDKCAAA